MANGYYLSAVIDDRLLNPQHLQTAITNLLLIQPALLQMLYELQMIPLESSQQILDELAPAVLDLLQLLESVNAYIFSLVHSISSQLNSAESCISYVLLLQAGYFLF